MTCVYAMGKEIQALTRIAYWKYQGNLKLPVAIFDIIWILLTWKKSNTQISRAERNWENVRFLMTSFELLGTALARIPNSMCQSVPIILTNTLF